MIDGSDGNRSSLRFALGLGSITLAALVVRILFVVVVDPSVPRLGDASAYHLLGEGLARGDGYIRPFDHLLLHQSRATAEYPPLFPMLLAIPARLGMHSVESQRLFVTFVGAATVALIGLLGRRVGGTTVGLVAAAIAAVSPMLFQSEGILMAEALYVPLVVTMLLCAYRVYDNPTRARFAVLGAVTGLAALTRAEGLLIGLILVVILAIGAGVRGRGGGGGGGEAPVSPRFRGLTGASLAITVAVVVLAPWTIRNAVKFDTFVPISNNAATLVDGANCDATYNGTLLGLWRGIFVDREAARTAPQAQACFEGFDIQDPNFDEAKVAAKHRDDGTRYARAHVSKLPKVMTVRVLRTWGLYAPSQQVDYESLEGRPRDWQMRGTVLDWVLLPFAIAGIVILRRRRVPIGPFLATVIAVTLTAAFTYGQQRFRVAAEPALYVCAAVALVSVWQRTISRRNNVANAASR